MYYQKIIGCLVSLFILNTCPFAQTTDQKIKTIRAEFQKINRDSSLQSITLDNPEDFLGEATDGGGELTGYFKNDSLRKMLLTVWISYGQIYQEYYFKKDQLIFVYETEKDFPVDSANQINHEKLTLAFEGRYYFDDDKLMRRVAEGSKRINDENEADNLLKNATQFMKLLVGKRKEQEH